MEYGVTSCGGVAYGAFVSKISIVKHDAGHVGEILQPSRREIIETNNRMTVGDQSSAEVRPDEPRSSRDEHPHRFYKNRSL
jgi:hypothetical protein